VVIGRWMVLAAIFLIVVPQRFDREKVVADLMFCILSLTVPSFSRLICTGNAWNHNVLGVSCVSTTRNKYWNFHTESL
jgi:hypothetical protein